MASVFAVSTSAPNLNTNAGPMFIGTFVATALWAGSLAQAWHYVAKYPDDRLLHKFWVAGVCVSSTVSIIFLVGSAYLNFVSNFGNVALLLNDTNPLSGAEIAAASTMYVQVQTFYVYRIWKLSDNICVTIILESFVLLQLALSIALTVLISWGSTIRQHPGIAAVACMNTVFLDIALSATVCTLLRRQAFNMKGRTRALVQRLIVFSLSTGALPAMLAFLLLITFFAFPHNGLFKGLYPPQSFLYANSMLAALNARSYILRFNNGAISDQISDLIAVQSMPQLTGATANGYERSRTVPAEEGLQVPIQLVNITEPVCDDVFTAKSSPKLPHERVFPRKLESASC